MLKMLDIIRLLAVLVLAGCANQRFEWNLAHQRLSPEVRKLPEADIREITRLVSERSGAPIVCMRSTGNKGPDAGQIWVVTADSTTMENRDNGLFQLKKQNGVWRIIDGGFGLSTSLIICSDG
jgi:hypothetical protein